MTNLFMVIGITGWIALFASIYLYKKIKDEKVKSITVEEKKIQNLI